jgi:SRSO17 transposase
MTPGELAAVRGRLEEFAAEMFAPLARSDQRAKGQTYVRGLLLDGRRKSMQPMAERLGVDHQGAAAVRLLLHLGGGAGARAAGRPGGRGDRPRGLGG